MVSRLRIQAPGVPLHFVQRGHNREPCFFDEQDYRTYLYWLRDALGRWDVRLHAFVLMTNHVHLLLTPQRPDAISGLAISVGRRYVQYINGKYRRTGTLWDGRYKSSPIDDEAYLLACYRYIELNPVRAGIVQDPADYDWSSFRHNALGEANAMLTPADGYRAMGDSPALRQQAYRELVADALHDDTLTDIRLALRHGCPIGHPAAPPS